MQQKTTKEIIEDMDYSGGINWNKMLPLETPEYAQTWIDKNDILLKIEEHTNCHKYHSIDGKQATCLDVIQKEIIEVKPNSSHD